MGYAFYWTNNDGLGGHVWLSDGDLRALTDEMLVQGMPWPVERVAAADPIAADEVDAVLAPCRGDGEADDRDGEAGPGLDRPSRSHPSAEPLVLTDSKLWRDWIEFLEGAARNGGLVVRR